MKSKRKKIIKFNNNYKVNKNERYLTGVFKLKPTSNIEEAQNYGVFANIYRKIANSKKNKFWSYFHNFRIVNTLSIDADFDSRLEMQMGGIKGFINKLLLKALRFLDKQRSKITHKEDE